jgi:inhibitor of cysteine peptidase
MKKGLSVLAVVFMAVIASAGCCPQTGGLEVKLAPIHEVQINIAESFPEQIFVYIKGGLADSCTSFHDLKTERIGNTIKIEVTTERPRDAVCAQVYGYFEKNINLGSDFTRGESYTVDVNGVTQTFVYPGLP